MLYRVTLKINSFEYQSFFFLIIVAFLYHCNLDSAIVYRVQILSIHLLSLTINAWNLGEFE